MVSADSSLLSTWFTKIIVQERWLLPEYLFLSWSQDVTLKPLSHAYSDFWELKNVKKAGELVGIDMLFLDDQVSVS